MTRHIKALVVLAGAVALAACSAPAGSGPTNAPGSASVAAPSASSSAGETPASSSPAATAEVAPIEGYESILVDGTYTTEKICAAYKAKIGKYLGAANSRISSGSSSAQGPYEAAAYRKGHSWLKDKLADRFDSSMDASATQALNSLSGNRAGEIDSIDDYLRDSIDSCGLTSMLAKARTQTGKADSLGDRIIRQARQKPWYPKGYQDYGNDMAFRWVNNAGADCFTQCWYFTVDVVSKDGCPSNVYAEVTMERGGSVVDWTNDSLSYLGPRQRGRMQFITYSDNAYGATGRLTELSCY